MSEQTYKVTIERLFISSGFAEISATSGKEAVKIIDSMIRNGNISSGDISWSNPIYIDGTFKTTGGVDDSV